MALGTTNVVQNHGDENNIKRPIRKQQGLGCASDLRGAGVNQAVSGDSQRFLKVQRNWRASGSREAASPASKLENAEIRAPGRYLAICASH
jgi:hypothetical protein